MFVEFAFTRHLINSLIDLFIHPFPISLPWFNYFLLHLPLSGKFNLLFTCSLFLHLLYDRGAINIC